MQPGSSLFSDIGGWALTSSKDPGLTDTNKNRICNKNDKCSKRMKNLHLPTPH